MLERNLILHLTLLDGIGPAIIQKIMQSQRSGAQASDLYLLSHVDLMHFFGLSTETAQRIVVGLANKKILETELTLIAQNNIEWITFFDEKYPQLLREIHLPPMVLYYQGKFTCVENNSIEKKSFAIVGSRKADAYGQHIINQFVPDLVAAGYTIVSGGALGIDTAAHEVTLQSGGKTIAVLGSGLLMPHPRTNKKLFKDIVDRGGAVISSYPLTMEALPGNFPARNRIITGLSRGCLVVQAAQKSGALISAHYAMEQGRDVFAVPGRIDDELSAGCNALIQQGAKLVFSSNDILEEFGDRIIKPDVRATQQKAQQLLLDSMLVTDKTKKEMFIAAQKTVLCDDEKWSDVQKQIIVACKRPSSLDDIVYATQLTTELVQSELFNLQLDGIVSQDFTGMWVALR